MQSRRIRRLVESTSARAPHLNTHRAASCRHGRSRRSPRSPREIWRRTEGRESRQVLDSSSARWSPMGRRRRSRPWQWRKGPRGSGVKVGRSRANIKQKPFAQAELENPHTPSHPLASAASVPPPAPYCWRHQPSMDDAPIVFDQMCINVYIVFFYTRSILLTYLYSCALHIY